MGNSASSSRGPHDDTVDYGFLCSQGVYTGPRDWNHQIVSQFIVDRRLAPFYRPLEDYEDSWDDEQILAARKELPDPDVATSESGARSENGGLPARSSSMNSTRRSNTLKEPSRIPEAMVYRGAAECPICFLYYPPNINRSRCCDQAICTECFVQIKRSEPTATHLVSEPAACPYCVQDNFGIVYTPPPWRAGIGADSMHSPIHPTNSRTSSQQSMDSGSSKDKGRRKSFGADSADVVTIDQIRPDWESKLAAVRAAVARRANRRIIMRQVGDRLIPVGVTSGRIHPLSGEVTAGGEQGAETPTENEARGSRRSRRRQHQQQPQDLNQLLGNMGLGGQDLEELMIMEAMRLSLLDHEEQQRKEAEKKKKEGGQQTANGGIGGGSGDAVNEPGPSSSSSASRLELPPIPTASPIEMNRPSALNSSSSLGSSPGDHGLSSVNLRTPPISGSPSQQGGLSSSARPHAPVVPSPLGPAAAAASLGVATPAASGTHSRSESHSRSGSWATTATPQPRRSGDFTNPPPFSTLSAALAAHGAATAFLNVGDRGGLESEVASWVGPSTDSTAIEPLANLTTVTSLPLAEEVPSAPPQLTRLKMSSQSPASASAPASGPAPSNVSSTSLGSTAAAEHSHSYDELPSSPESTISHRPLLLETPSAENPDPADAFRLSGPSVQTDTHPLQ